MILLECRNIPFDVLPQIMKRVIDKETVTVSNTHEMPPEWVKDQMEFENEGSNYTIFLRNVNKFNIL